jgi:lipid-A-disaccharide synthase
MGGDNMRNQGVDTVVDIADLGVVGIVEVLVSYRRLKAVLESIKQSISADRPDLLILVDYQEFNQRLAAYAKSIGIKVLFYISPQFWAWRPKRVFKMADIVDHMAVIFPFEAPPYEAAGVPVTFTGHPLVDECQPDKTTEQARQSLGIDNRLTIGLFPGSRNVELQRLLPVQLAAAQQLRENYPDCQFVLPQASTISHDRLNEFMPKLLALNVHIIRNDTHDTIQACDVIMVTSGTATLEIGLFAKPMVIMHKVAALSYMILRPLVKLKHIGLVNIVPGKEIVKEFIQHDATADNIATEVRHILDDEVYRNIMCEELGKLRTLLGDGGGSLKIAQLALDMLD